MGTRGGEQYRRLPSGAHLSSALAHHLPSVIFLVRSPLEILLQLHTYSSFHPKETRVLEQSEKAECFRSATHFLFITRVVNLSTGGLDHTVIVIPFPQRNDSQAYIWSNWDKRKVSILILYPLTNLKGVDAYVRFSAD